MKMKVLVFLFAFFSFAQIVSPHFATIRPNYNTKTYTTDIVEVANVGSKNEVLKISDKDCFKTRDISLYYNKLQQFEKNLDVIKHF